MKNVIFIFKISIIENKCYKTIFITIIMKCIMTKNNDQLKGQLSVHAFP